MADLAGTSRDAPDLNAVDELCRLAFAARRLGCRVQILDVDPPLLELLVLAGVDDMLVQNASDGCSADEPDRPERPDRSDLS